MVQTILVITIVVLASVVAGFRVFRFFTASRSSGCSPEQCASCPYSARPSDCRPGPEKK
ncbi:MAG TPA: FeoB-associated Cys-rich membrane protein [Spirochaetota bacterium]|nr:FeoB-associated Cys-rich membrane protein [Spirochaetota bacterium]HOD13212.1 FeoB-associated Cys-rich membrane protein [Spirochaetota bacterium]HPG48980.1 FeoB-associated Cys-rich membrane protein [Spirochaetota bacterium]HPN10489.1 FeoB-associated Cys-rich membrane protein [Spirochaetota bacterium]HQL82678.1 FeoB-associated Cys-rich membrane protein [Spirochaetota bacterium]